MNTSQPPHRAVLLDMDGVLVDSTSAHLQAWARFLDEHDLPPPPEGIASLFGRPAAEALRLLLDDRTDEAGFAVRLAALHRYADALLDEHAPGELVVPGTERLVDDLLAVGRRLAVVTSARRNAAEHSLGDLTSRIEVVVTAEDVQRGKPDPEPYLIAASRLAVPPSACVVVEDAVAGVEAGRRAGMVVIAVASTAAAEDLRAAGAREVVQDLSGLHGQLLAEPPPPTTDDDRHRHQEAPRERTDR